MLPDINQRNNYYLYQLQRYGGIRPKNAAVDQLNNVRRQNEAHALMQAVRNVDFRATCSLLNSGVDPNQIPFETSTNSKFAPLHIAAASDSPFASAIVDQLLRAGADANIRARGCDGITPVHIACLTGNHNVLQLLLDCEGDPHQLDRTGRSPYACAGQSIKCMTLLRAYDGRTDKTPATPEKTVKFSPRMRRNSLTSISSNAPSDYHSCVADNDDDEEMGAVFATPTGKGRPPEILPATVPSLLRRRNSEPQLVQLKTPVKTKSPKKQTSDATDVIRSPPSKTDIKNLIDNEIVASERYRVAPSAPIASESDRSGGKTLKHAVRMFNTEDAVKNNTDRHRKRRHRVVGFRESTRGEFSLYDDPEFLDLCNRVDRALRISKRYNDNKRNASAADSAFETDTSAISNDEEPVKENECMRYHKHHHRRHRDSSKHPQDYYRSRSAGNISSATPTTLVTTSSRQSFPLTTKKTNSSHDRKSEKEAKKSRNVKSTSARDGILASDADIDAHLTADDKNAAALYGYLACLNDRQLRQVLIRHGVHANPIISVTTRFLYIRKLVSSLTGVAENSPSTVERKAAEEEQFPSSSFHTPTKKSPNADQTLHKQQKPKHFSTTGDKNYEMQPGIMLFNPNAAENYADFYKIHSKAPKSERVRDASRESPVTIYLPENVTHTHRGSKTGVVERTEKNGLNKFAGANDDADDVLHFCRELKSVLFQLLEPVEQQGLVDELHEAGQINSRHLNNPSKKPTKGYFCYLLLDPRILQKPLRTQVSSLLSEEQRNFAKFLRAIFYVGKGKRSRPMSHLVEARRRVRSAPDEENVGIDDNDDKGGKMHRICDIWRSGYGVVQIQCFHNCTEADAFNREAVMIEALIASSTDADGECVIDGGGERKRHSSKTIPGNANKTLTNAQRGSCYGVVKHSWSPVKKRLAGAVLLHKAFQIFCVEGESQLRASEIEN